MKKTIIFLLIIISSSSCKKFLEAKPDATLTVPSNIDDLQLMLDAYTVMNIWFPVSVEEGTDDFFLTNAELNAQTEPVRNIYLWKKEDRVGASTWVNAYKTAFIANSVLQEYAKLTVSPSDGIKANNVKGSALFYRSYMYYFLSQVYAPPYRKENAQDKTGIPLRVDPDLEVKSVRSTLQETYDFITRDLKEAASLLPVTPTVVSRPSKPAAFGALARVYLSMREYALAGEYADSCLKYANTLLDYNGVSTTINAPFTRLKNPEVIFHAKSQGTSLLGSVGKVDTFLQRSYHTDDLRRLVFFRTQPANPSYYLFKGDYDGASGNLAFTGIVTDEMYLIRAESYARAGDVVKAMQDLNTLLVKRWKKDKFVAFTANTAAEALSIILTERRKQLIRRGSRWTDLRRLKDDPQYSVTPQRLYNSQSYTLPPGSPRYTFQIPFQVIQYSSIEQNQ